MNMVTDFVVGWRDRGDLVHEYGTGPAVTIRSIPPNPNHPGPQNNLRYQDKSKLEPEELFFEGAPHWSEVVVPAISILTVIGIIPFASSVARQIWVCARH